VECRKIQKKTKDAPRSIFAAFLQARSRGFTQSYFVSESRVVKAETASLLLLDPARRNFISTCAGIGPDVSKMRLKLAKALPEPLPREPAHRH